jgi:hypothetical protein
MENTEQKIKIIQATREAIDKSMSTHKDGYKIGMEHALKTTESMATFMSIVAGFGFTVYEHSNKVLFLTGESILIFGILLILYKLKIFTRNQINFSSDSMEEVYKIEEQFFASKSVINNEKEYLSVMQNVWNDINQSAKKGNYAIKNNSIKFNSDLYFYMLCVGCFLIPLSLAVGNCIK